MEGKILRSGLRVRYLSFTEFLNLIYSLMVDDIDGWVNKDEMRDTVDKFLSQESPSVESWGTSELARSGEEAMKRLLGQM